jgi:hypothetical protein
LKNSPPTARRSLLTYQKVSGNYSAGMGAARLVRHHATVFLDPERSKPVEILRSRWDPQMSQQIAAHVTLIYPEEVADPIELDELVRAAVARTGPFRLALREAFFAGSPADGVFLLLRMSTVASPRSAPRQFRLRAPSIFRRTSQSCIPGHPYSGSRRGDRWLRLI